MRLSLRIRRIPLGLFASVLGAYALSAYWGIRSVDGEVLYRTAESLALEGDFSITPVELWPEFGVAQGRDGQAYSKYGPALPLIAAPVAWLATHVTPTEGVNWPGPSFWISGGLGALNARRPPPDGAAHFRRGLVSAVNLLLSALAVLALWSLLIRLQVQPGAANLTAILFAFGTPLFAYSSTFLAEPLLTLCVLRCCDGLIEAHRTKRARHLFASGLWLALALVTHITAFLWVPFLAMSSWIAASQDGRRPRSAALAGFALPVVIAVAGLVVFDLVRFGHAFGAGRPVEDFEFGAPWVNLGPVLWSWGKGLFVFCPALIASLAAWPLLVRCIGPMAWILLSGVAARILLFSSFHDWHGGLGPGPRYLLPEIGLLMVPAGLLLGRWLRRGGAFCAAAIGLACLCILQQTWLVIGELFSWCDYWSRFFQARGGDVLMEDALYLDRLFSPWQIGYLLHNTGPATLRALQLGAGTAYLLWGFTLCSIAVGAVVFTSRAQRAAQTRSR
jgi:hypothetical protein